MCVCVKMFLKMFQSRILKCEKVWENKLCDLCALSFKSLKSYEFKTFPDCSCTLKFRIKKSLYVCVCVEVYVYNQEATIPEDISTITTQGIGPYRVAQANAACAYVCVCVCVGYCAYVHYQARANI